MLILYRDIQPRALVQLRERTTSYDSLSSSPNEMSSFDSRYHGEYSYNTLPVRGRRGNDQQQYAESLQDFPMRPRSGSGDSLRSDSFLSRPQRNYNPSTDRVSYVNSGFLSPQNPKKKVHEEGRMTTERSYFEIKPAVNDAQKTRNENSAIYTKLSEPPKMKQTRSSEKDKKG